MYIYVKMNLKLNGSVLLYALSTTNHGLHPTALHLSKALRDWAHNLWSVSGGQVLCASEFRTELRAAEQQEEVLNLFQKK